LGATAKYETSFYRSCGIFFLNDRSEGNPSSPKFRRERIHHCYGQSYRDIARVLARDFSNPPDFVAFPGTEEDIVALMKFAEKNGGT
jgi:hypothetical protein